MKRKGKIITTVASLCLALALMAFGVYAANSVTMGVTSKVQFVVTDVFAIVTGNLKKGSVAASGGASTTAGEVTDNVTWVDVDLTNDGTNLANYAATPTFATDSNTGVRTPIAVLDGEGTIADWNAGLFQYTSTYVWFKLEMTVKNDAPAGEDSIYLQVDKVFQTLGNTACASTYAVDNATPVLAGTALTASTVITIEPQKTATLTFVRRVLDTSKKVEESYNFANEEMTLTITHANPTPSQEP